MFKPIGGHTIRGMPADFCDTDTEKIIEFIRDVGIAVGDGEVGDQSFLPGIEVVEGSLVVDRQKLKYPGDLLHEAGHLAVTPSVYRLSLSGEVLTPDSTTELIEMEAMLWSYAACLYLGLDPRVVFHENGYHGQSDALLQNFGIGVFLGVEGLQRAEMTFSRSEAERLGREPFPVMQKWLKD